GDPEAIVLLPRHRAFDPAEIAQIDRHQRAARHRDIAFGHHAARRKVAHLDARFAFPAIDLELGKQKQAVATVLAGIDVAHRFVTIVFRCLHGLRPMTEAAQYAICAKRALYPGAWLTAG